MKILIVSIWIYYKSLFVTNYQLLVCVTLSMIYALVE